MEKSLRVLHLESPTLGSNRHKSGFLHVKDKQDINVRGEEQNSQGLNKPQLGWSEPHLPENEWQRKGRRFLSHWMSTPETS